MPSPQVVLQTLGAPAQTKPNSVLQVALQPSSPALLPSSQLSLPAVMPSPQVVSQTLGAPAQA